MADPFVHLRVASGYSLKHGAATPADLVTRAADFEMDTLALTDRDGLYGAIRFAKACQQSGVAPVLGVDLALPREYPGANRRAPATADDLRLLQAQVQTSADRDLGLPRVVLLARSRAGWAALCRLVTASHQAGQRGAPILDLPTLLKYAATGELVLLLGPDSEFGELVATDRRTEATACLDRWRTRLPGDQLVVAVADHQIAATAGRTGTRHRAPQRYATGSLEQAARMLSLADAAGTTVVLTNQVRMVDREQAMVTDVLDCARRLVPLSSRNVDRRNAEAYLKSGKQMLELAHLVAQRGGRGPGGAERLLAETRNLAIGCRLDPRADLGLGEIHLPELDVLTDDPRPAAAVLAERCAAGLHRRYGTPDRAARDRLEQELEVIGGLGFETYFLTVADVVETVRGMGIRCAARGSGAGSLVNFALGISGVDPMRYGLLMERFCSPLRRALPDIDLDVESARRPEIYERILADFGTERVTCVAMLETYRVRHAVRDVGAALSLPPSEIDAIAKAFPHIRARDARAALRDLPELQAAGLTERRFDLMFSLVEQLDGLPRHVALHPCGVLLSDATLGDRTPIEYSFGGFPMSQFDKDDVEDIGLLKLDVLGIRMQSAMQHAVSEVARVTGVQIDLDALADPDPDGNQFTDPPTYELIRSTHTLGCFQIESPGQRELVGKLQPRTFNDIVIDISLFRPGPVKSDMVVPFLNARHGWADPQYLHPDLKPHLAETGGVVVFHEQVIRTIAVFTGCTLAQADEVRRALGVRDLQGEVKEWFYPLARARGYSAEVIDKVWFVLESFASFGFCKAHAAAFALPTYQSAWLKAHHPAAFLAGVLTHDPGMYPKRLILEEVRRMGIRVLGLDVNESGAEYRIVHLGPEPAPPGHPLSAADQSGIPEPDRLDVPAVDQSGRDRPEHWGVRIPVAEVKGIDEAEVARIVAGQPYRSLPDFWNRARVSEPVTERIILAGGFDAIHRIGRATGVPRRGQLTRRDLLLHLADLRHHEPAAGMRARGLRLKRSGPHRWETPDDRSPDDRSPNDSGPGTAASPHRVTQPAVQLPLDLGQTLEPEASGLPEMTDAERVRAELEVLGLDASRHVVDFYRPLLDALRITRAVDLLQTRRRSGILVAGVKVATQTPPVRSGRRVVFLTLDDTTGPVDATFFEDAQGPYARTLFGSWLLLVRGDLRRTGARGVSLRATGCWDLAALYATWQARLEAGDSYDRALAAVYAEIDRVPEGFAPPGHRVLVHPSGFTQSAYADIKPAGGTAGEAPRKLWHSSPGSSGH
ncbi:DNA polymerase III subunit alpha [Granulicoccus phenolivorans]|uniref:DNA polymerase III subunit alpha n=1 Tax=Granulicoccus phenolivorans TaxID=266854 RepID=UPI0003F76197|nr:DNA polymerase III subunit alpha [Granulicoccus phenolivorans]